MCLGIAGTKVGVCVYVCVCVCVCVEKQLREKKPVNWSVNSR